MRFWQEQIHVHGDTVSYKYNDEHIEINYWIIVLRPLDNLDISGVTFLYIKMNLN